MSGRARTICTGCAPPRVQVSAQVRTSTGFTWGVATDEGPVLLALSPQQRDVRQHEARRLRAIAHRLLRELESLAAARTSLPGVRAIADVFRLEDGAEIEAAFQILVGEGSVAQWRGHSGFWPGERVVRLRASGRVLRTPGAPRHITP